MRVYTVILLSIFTLFCYAQNDTEYLTKSEIENDLKFLDDILQNKSSYQGLNGFDYRKDFENYLKQIDGTKITKSDFGLFLSKTIGQIGDRHSYIKGYDLPETLYFPISFAPFENKVLALQRDKVAKQYFFWNSEFPYIKSINNIDIEKILPQILPGDILAPEKSYFLRSIRDLRDIETVFAIMNLELPNPLPVTLINKQEVEKKISLRLASKNHKAKLWDERYNKDNFNFERNKKKRNNPEIIQQFFSLEDEIGYIQIPSMANKDNSPIFFDLMNEFMLKAIDSDALIVDVRDNGGGSRQLIQELSGYFVHPDSIYVVNATRQIGKLPLNIELKERLHHRYLFSKKELDKREQNEIDQFINSFNPMYDLDDKKFSEYYFYVLNGKKLSQNKYYYDKPIYILANERSFSAASILVSVFKGLPNIKVVGVNTDGSSGNSERFKLPNSGLRGKISTMVSYQKDGRILDGIGTQPDITIERNLDQIFFKEDYQLTKLKEIIIDK